jgi:uncharacterized membrane protein required for colicin V production
MNFVIDLLLVAICFFIIFYSAKRGFVRSVMGFGSKIAALVVAYTFTPTVSAYIKARYLLGPLSESIASSIKSSVTTPAGYDFTNLAEKVPNVIERYLVSSEDLEAKIEAMQKTGDEALRYVSESIADKVSGMIATALAFIGLFVLTCAALWIVTRIVDAVFKLPVLRTANTVLGVAFGVCSAVLITVVYCSVIPVVISALGAVAPKYFGEDVIEKTMIVRFFANRDLLNFAQNIIS